MPNMANMTLPNTKYGKRDTSSEDLHRTGNPKWENLNTLDLPLKELCHEIQQN